MRRVLVPLDGSHLAESILPDARRMAGRDGTLILIQGVGELKFGYQMRETSDGPAVADTESYLEGVAEALRAEDIGVETHVFMTRDLAFSIDQAAVVFDADMIACATHGRGPMGRLIRGGVAWRAVANSAVPVLLRHAEDSPRHESIFAGPSHIMVPLDGSAYAERALALASQLALEWRAAITLVRVVPDLPVMAATYGPAMYAYDTTDDVEAARAYLGQVAAGLTGDVHACIATGPTLERLAEVAESASITNIVIASHGRTGLPRVVLGSVTDALIHRLHLPIVVIPTMVQRMREDSARGREPVAASQSGSQGANKC